jgi:tetratricopeptide (TPR) repeat protein
VIEHFKSGEDFQAVSILVDPRSELAIPFRLMKPADLPVFEAGTDSWNFTFELDDFVGLGRRSERRLREWTNAEGLTPPDIFVSYFNADWIKFHAIEYRRSKSEWQQSIDFVVEHWPEGFRESVFLRPAKCEEFRTVGTGPTITVRQSDKVRVSLDLYNQHLSDSQLATKRLSVAVSDVMADIAPCPPIVTDGEVAISLTLLEPGEARIIIDVQPDAHFSAYIPIVAAVESDPNLDPAGPRALGPTWRHFLSGCTSEASADELGALRLFDRLNEVFPGEPELMLQRGMLHFRRGNFAAARNDFEKVLEQRNDARGVWWALIVALHLNDESLAHQLLERATAIPSSEENRVAFESAIKHFSGLDDSVIESFCGYPRAITSDTTALKMLVEMTKGSRRERALQAVLEEIGKLSSGVAIRELDDILAQNPNRRELRLLRARLAVKAKLLQKGEPDVELLIQYSGQDIGEYMELVRELKPLVRPQSLPTVLYSNALRLFATDNRDGALAAIEIGIEAAATAVANGDINEALRCLGFVELRMLENEGDNRRFRSTLDQFSSRVNDLLATSAAVSSLVDADLEALAAQIRTDLEGKTVVVFGGQSSPEKESRLKDYLGLARLVWLPWNESEAPNAKKLLQYVGEAAVIHIVSLDNGLISSAVWVELRQRKVAISRSLDNLASILAALRSAVQQEVDSQIYVPGTCEEALALAQRRCPNLEFSPKVGDRIAELDEYQHADRVRARIVSDLELLNRYAADAQSGRVGAGTRNWLVLNGFAASNFSAFESDTTSNNAKLRAERTFDCSRGRVFMPEHFRLPGEYPTEGRIHFSTEFAAREGRVIIGYIGPHLSLKN